MLGGRSLRNVITVFTILVIQACGTSTTTTPTRTKAASSTATHSWTATPSVTHSHAMGSATPFNTYSSTMSLSPSRLVSQSTVASRSPTLTPSFTLSPRGSVSLSSHVSSSISTSVAPAPVSSSASITSSHTPTVSPTSVSSAADSPAAFSVSATLSITPRASFSTSISLSASPSPASVSPSQSPSLCTCSCSTPSCCANVTLELIDCNHSVQSSSSWPVSQILWAAIPSALACVLIAGAIACVVALDRRDKQLMAFVVTAVSPTNSVAASVAPDAVVVEPVEVQAPAIILKQKEDEEEEVNRDKQSTVVEKKGKEEGKEEGKARAASVDTMADPMLPPTPSGTTSPTPPDADSPPLPSSTAPSSHTVWRPRNGRRKGNRDMSRLWSDGARATLNTQQQRNNVLMRQSNGSFVVMDGLSLLHSPQRVDPFTPTTTLHLVPTSVVADALEGSPSPITRDVEVEVQPVSPSPFTRRRLKGRRKRRGGRRGNSGKLLALALQHIASGGDVDESPRTLGKSLDQLHRQLDVKKKRKKSSRSSSPLRLANTRTYLTEFDPFAVDAPLHTQYSQ